LLIRFYTILLFIIFVFPLEGSNRPDNLIFTSITKSNGLPSNLIHCTYKDRNGFLWIGTSRGLARYDGHERFKIFSKEHYPTFKSNYITSIAEDDSHVLWVGTRYGGIMTLDLRTDKWTTYMYEESNENSLSNNEVLEILVDSYNRVWIGTEDGLNIYNREADNFIRYMPSNEPYGLQSKAILEIKEDSNGFIWLGTWGSGLYLVLNSKEQEDLSFRKIGMSDKVDNVWSIQQFSDTEYWLGTHDVGLIYMVIPDEASNLRENQDWEVFSKKTKTGLEMGKRVLYFSIFDLAIMGQDLWLATPSGLFVLKNHNEEIKDWKSDTSGKINLKFTSYMSIPNDQTSLVNENISKLNTEDDGIIWISTRGGLCYHNKHHNQFDNLTLTQQQIQRPNAPNLINVGNSLWLCNGNSDIVSFNIKTELVDTYSSNKIKSIIQDNNIYLVNKTVDEKLVLISNLGIYAIDIHSWNYKYYPFTKSILNKTSNFLAKCFYEDRNGYYWVGSEIGLLRLDIRSESFLHITTIDDNTSNGITENSVTCFAEDNENNLWIGTYNGLNKLVDHSSKLIFQHFKNDPTDSLSLRVNRISTLENTTDYMVIGTEQGLVLYDYKSQSFSNDKYSSREIQIYANHNFKDSIIWSSSSEGLIKFDLITGSSHLYAREEGIKDLAFSLGSVTTDQDGFIYFGNSSGALKIHPDKHKDVDFKTKMCISEANIIGKDGHRTKSMFYSDNLELRHGDYYLSLSYVGLNYVNPSSNEFSYKLEGFDSDWIYPVDESPAVYTNLEPNSYSFRLRLMNSNGHWSEMQSPLTINVIPAFWKTSWFSFLLFLFVCALILSAFHLYTKAIRKRNLILEKLNTKLNNEVTQRTKITEDLEQSEQELKTANSELLRSNKQLEQFAYIASHDLKEPLRTIGSFTELTQRRISSTADEKVIEYTNMVKGAVSRMYSLIESILTFSSVGKGNLKAEKVNVNHIIEDVISDLAQVIKGKGTRILKEELPTLWGDRSQFSMLFQNLISNGIKFNVSKDPYLNIYITDRDNSVYDVIVVEDNGIGIHKDHQDRIFELFKRLHANSEFEGTGIGLAVCKRIIELHEGKLEIISKVGFGTKFLIYLPKYTECEKVREANQDRQFD